MGIKYNKDPVVVLSLVGSVLAPVLCWVTLLYIGDFYSSLAPLILIIPLCFVDIYIFEGRLYKKA